MLLLASLALLGKELTIPYVTASLAQRDVQDFQLFFDNLGLKTELKNEDNSTLAPVTSIFFDGVHDCLYLTLKWISEQTTGRDPKN